MRGCRQGEFGEGIRDESCGSARPGCRPAGTGFAELRDQPRNGMLNHCDHPDSRDEAQGHQRRDQVRQTRDLHLPQRRWPSIPGQAGTCRRPPEPTRRGAGEAARQPTRVSRADTTSILPAGRDCKGLFRLSFASARHLEDSLAVPEALPGTPRSVRRPPRCRQRRSRRRSCDLRRLTTAIAVVKYCHCKSWWSLRRQLCSRRSMEARWLLGGKGSRHGQRS